MIEKCFRLNFSRVIFLLSFCLINIDSAQSKIPQEAVKPFAFIAISDIHFDPFIGCHFQKSCQTFALLVNNPVTKWETILSKNPGQMTGRLLLGMDSNLELLNRTLATLMLQLKQTKAGFIVHTGDLIAHNMESNYQRYFKSRQGYQAFVHKLFQYLQAKLQSAAGKVPVYFVMGNNDGYRGDYISNAGGAFFKDLANDWEGLKQKNNENSRLLAKSGNYSVEVAPNWRLIMLNTNLFYKKTKGKLKSVYAHESMQWLSKQLEMAYKLKQHVLMFYHIPYGVIPSKRFMNQETAALWDGDINHKFYDLVTIYRTQIKGLIHGHIHREAFMALHTNTTAPLPQHLVSSVSPIFGNIPTFKIFHYKNNKLFINTIPLTNGNALF